jgi:transposase
LEDYLHANPLLVRGYQLKTRVHLLLTEHDPAALDQWSEEAETVGLHSFCTLARSFRQDNAAIAAALTTPRSTRPCEGHLCRVKLLKRLGYGLAKLDWLGQRILHRIGAPMTFVRDERQVQHQVAA